MSFKFEKIEKAFGNCYCQFCNEFVLRSNYYSWYEHGNLITKELCYDHASAIQEKYNGIIKEIDDYFKIKEVDKYDS